MAKTDTPNKTESTILEATTIRLHKGEFCIELTNQADDKLLTFHSLVLKELNEKMYSSELYDDYMSIVEATDKK